MSQHRATCARKYWRKVQQHANLDYVDVAQSKSQLCPSRISPPNEFAENNLHFQIEELSEAQEKNHALRIVCENTFDARLSADALTQALRWFEDTKNVEFYKAALVTALRLNISIGDLRPPHERDHLFYQLSLIATYLDEIVRGVRQVNDLDYKHGTTILHAACYAGFAELLEPLFWRGACFDALDLFDGTPLDSAIHSGDIDTVRFALALGSDPNLRCPLHGAFSARRHDIIALLLKHGADINQSSGHTTILSAAIGEHDLGMIRLALSFGADPNVAHPMDALIEICIWDSCEDCVHKEMACLLVEHGADVTRQSPNGYTALHYAAMKAHTRLLRMVLDRIDSPMMLDVEKVTNERPIHCAIRTLKTLPPHWALISTSMLLEAGADVNVQDSKGKSALMIAAQRGSDELVRLLLDSGANVKNQCHRGQTALSFAAGRGHSTIVGLLLEKVPHIRIGGGR